MRRIRDQRKAAIKISKILQPHVLLSRPNEEIQWFLYDITRYLNLVVDVIEFIPVTRRLFYSTLSLGFNVGFL